MKHASKINSNSATPFIGVAVFLVVLFLLFKFWKTLTSFFSGGKAGVAKEENVKVTETAISAIFVKPSHLTRTKEHYKLVAQKQMEAMDHAGTDIKQLFETLEPLNSQELIQVYKDFGLRINSFFNFFGIVNTDKTDLFDWYRRELSGGDLSRMKGVWLHTKLIF